MKLTLIVISLLFVFIIRALIVLLHELGHAIPAILLTREKVTIYLGSYGNPEKSLHFEIGLLEVFVNYQNLYWKNGLCVPSAKNISKKKQFIYIAFGPVFPFLIALTAYLSALKFETDPSYLYATFFIIFLLLATIDLFTNLIPKSKPIELFNGKNTYNDGYYIKRFLFPDPVYSEYLKALQLYNLKDYKSAAILFDNLLKTEIEREHILRLNISSNAQIKDYQRAKVLIDEFVPNFNLDSNDYSTAGLIYSFLGFHEQGIEYYDKSLELDSNNVYSLNNKGYTLNLLERYKEAIPYFDQAILVEKEFAYAYNNRGLSKIKIGETNEGLLDIQKSIKLDENNSYNYRNLGIYHYDLGEFDKALELFLKAKNLDPDTHMIEDLILNTEKMNH